MRGPRSRGEHGIAVDGLGNLYIADTANHGVRFVDATSGLISTVAGNGTSVYAGDGGPAQDAGLEVAYGPTIIAGTPNKLGLFGDHGAATSALLFQPQAITKCPNGDLFIAGTGNSRGRRIAASTHVITTGLSDGSRAIPPATCS